QLSDDRTTYFLFSINSSNTLPHPPLSPAKKPVTALPPPKTLTGENSPNGSVFPLDNFTLASPVSSDIRLQSAELSRAIIRCENIPGPSGFGIVWIFKCGKTFNLGISFSLSPEILHSISISFSPFLSAVPLTILPDFSNVTFPNFLGYPHNSLPVATAASSSSYSNR